MRTNFGLVEQAAAEFVEEMQPADKARIGSFSNRIQLDPRDFTADRDVLYRILRTELQPEGPTPLWNAVNVGITALLHQHGRRVILVFTDGVDRPMNSAAQNVSLRDAMKRAEEENTIVYAIGLAGENSPVGGGAWRGPTGRGPGGRGPGGWPGGRGPGGPGPRSGRPFGRQGARSAKPDEGLSKIAAATGGGYFELTSTHDLGATFQRVADELHHQYALGFTPAVLDGKTHQLEVRVRRTGMSARARRSYVASPER